MDAQPQNLPKGPAPVQASGVLAFVLEVAMLCAASLWAIEAFQLNPIVSVLVVAVPLVVFWAVFMAPQARHRLRWPAQPIVAHALFLVGGLLLVSIGRGWLGAVMLALALCSALAVYLRREQRADEARRLRASLQGQRPEGRRAAR